MSGDILSNHAQRGRTTEFHRHPISLAWGTSRWPGQKVHLNSSRGLTLVGFSSFRKNSIEIISGGRVMLNCENVVLVFFLAASITGGSKEKWRGTPAWCEYRNLRRDLGETVYSRRGELLTLVLLFRHIWEHPPRARPDGYRVVVSCVQVTEDIAEKGEPLITRKPSVRCLCVKGNPPPELQ